MSKEYYYVQVLAQNKLKFITDIDNTKHISYWEDDKDFKIFSCKSYATEIANGLCLNGYYAFVVESLYKLEFKNKDLNN